MSYNSSGLQLARICPQKAVIAVTGLKSGDRAPRLCAGAQESEVELDRALSAKCPRLKELEEGLHCARGAFKARLARKRHEHQQR